MPSARFFFPMAEDVIPGIYNGIYIPRDAGPITPAEYGQSIFKLRTRSAAAYYGKVRELLMTSHVQIKSSGILFAEGDLNLTLKAVKSGYTPMYIMDPPDGEGERDWANGGGYYGEDSTQPNWFSYLDEDGNPTAATPMDPGPITMRFAEITPPDGYFTEDNEEYCTITGRTTSGPTISFLEGFFGVGEPGFSFGDGPGAITALFTGELPSVLGVPEDEFTLFLAGPSSGGVYADLIGDVTLSPSRWWGYNGKFDEATGARLT